MKVVLISKFWLLLGGQGTDKVFVLFW